MFTDPQCLPCNGCDSFPDMPLIVAFPQISSNIFLTQARKQYMSAPANQTDTQSLGPAILEYMEGYDHATQIKLHDHGYPTP